MLVGANLRRHGSSMTTPQVRPKVDSQLTEWGQSLCPALDRRLTWLEQGPSAAPTESPKPGP